jgi:hypothetical protein
MRWSPSANGKAVVRRCAEACEQMFAHLEETFD